MFGSFNYSRSMKLAFCSPQYGHQKCWSFFLSRENDQHLKENIVGKKKEYPHFYRGGSPLLIYLNTLCMALDECNGWVIKSNPKNIFQQISHLEDLFIKHIILFIEIKVNKYKWKRIVHSFLSTNIFPSKIMWIENQLWLCKTKGKIKMGRSSNNFRGFHFYN